MAIADLDFSGDQAVIDNKVVVTYTSVRTAGNQTAAVTDAAYYPEPTGEGGPSYGVYTKGRARFSIKVSSLSGVGGAKPRDTITLPSGRVYTVLSAEDGEITFVWYIEAVALALAADLRSTGTLSRPTNAQDASGRASLATYAAVASDVPCRVQPEASEAGDAMQRRTTPKHYTAFLASAVEARAKDRFVSDGVTYTVLGYEEPERIDELPRLRLERVA